jgi:pimeloyl-ACP methyl ester carboxylesterase
VLMDQRNAGESWAPVTAEDGWDRYTDDHLALLDHLGIERCHLVGMCNGGAFIANLIRRAPERVASAVVLQPIGLEDNRELFEGTFADFAAQQADRHPEAGEQDWTSFRDNLYGADHVLWSVPDEAVATFDVPLLVFAGGDEPHPASASQMLADVAPNATLVERWKAAEYNEAARESVANFLAVHTPS